MNEQTPKPAYEAPAVERRITSTELSSEIQYAGVQFTGSVSKKM